MFTPIEASIGAVLIQFATTNYYKDNGQTIGFSSAIFNSLKGSKDSLSIVIGLLCSSFFAKWYLPEFVPDHFSDDNKLLIIAGFLVGLGTKMCSGCTSGHMIGGLSRLRLRSIVATVLFSTSAMIMVNMHNGLKLPVNNYEISWNYEVFYNKTIISILAVSFLIVYILPSPSSTFSGVFSGFLFGLGLHISGMLSVSKTIGFLSVFTTHFDPSLIMIILFAVLPNIILWRNYEKPLFKPWNLNNSNELPPKFIIGAVIFGMGWGLLGVCPGPGLLSTVHTGSGAWLASFVAGQLFAAKIIG